MFARRWPLRVKITITVVVVLTTASLGLGKMAYGGIVNVVQGLLGEKAAGTAAAVEMLLPPQILSAEANELINTSGFASVMRTVRTLQKESSTDAIRLVRYVDGRTAQFLIDTAPEDWALARGPGKTENIDEDPGIFFTGVGTLPVEDERGGFLMMAWRQIRAADGEPVGSILAYVDANKESEYLKATEVTILGVALTLILLGGYLSYKLGAAFEMTAITDGLTGLYNHKHFKQRLEFECHRAARYRVPLSIVLMDIDRFKSVNDTYGHATGDLVLKNVAKWLKQSSRNTDLVARYGGEEMAVILPHTGLAGAQEFAERVRLKIANEVTRDQEEEVTLRVTVSLGVAQFEPGLSPMDLIKRADTALYQSKNNGRNRVTIWQDDLIPPLETIKAEPDKVPVETR